MSDPVAAGRARPAARRRGRLVSLALGTVAAFAALGVGGTTSIAAADFSAAPCDGTTSGSIASSLLTVSGQQQADYDAGKVVALYGPDGGAPTNASLPLCVVREVDGEPQSEWSFCTDYGKSSCAGVDGAGQPLQPAPAPVGSNPRLSAEQQRIIAYLIQHGYGIRDRDVSPGLSYGQWMADSSTTPRRRALQHLVWCISNPEATDMAPFCAANMTADDRRWILAQTKVPPRLSLSGPSKPAQVGEAARFTLTTNLQGQPITVQTSGGARLRVCGGEATLSGDQLVVAPGSSSVTLCATGTRAGTVSLMVSATPPSTRHIRWNWNGDQLCQVFATFDDVAAPTIDRAVSADFVAPSPPSSTPRPPVGDPSVGPSAKPKRGARLCVSKRVTRRKVRAGSRLVWRIRVRNCGRRTVRRVRACDRIRSGLVFDKANRRSRLVKGRRCFNLRTLKRGQTRTIKIRTRVLKGTSGRKCNAVIVTSRDAKRKTSSACARVIGRRLRAGGVTG